MDKKTLLNLIQNNLSEIETLINSLNEYYSIPYGETKIIKSKLKVLFEEIELLSSLNETEIIKKEKETSVTKKTETKEDRKQEDDIPVREEKIQKIETKTEVSTPEVVTKQEKIEPAEVIKTKKTETKTPSKTTHEKIQESGKKGIMADKFEVTKQSLNDIIAGSKKVKDIASVLKDKPIADLTKAISINDKIRFTKELFNGKNDVYLNAVKTLNECADLDEALQYLNNNYTWDQDKESFREFLELIYRRFVNV